MPCVSEARLLANRANALKSTGPRTVEGKEASRANSYKHGLTGAGTVLPEREAAEVQRRYVTFCAEARPTGEIGYTLALRAATLSVRLERCATHETAVLAERVRRAEAGFEAPEGLDPAEERKLREAAGHRALFDASVEATLARKYESAAERGFFRALKELRQHERALRAAEVAVEDEVLGSILPGEMSDEEFDAMYAELGVPEVGESPVPARVGLIPTDPEARKRRPKLPIAGKSRR